MIVPYDGSARSLRARPVADAAAAAWGCEVDVVHVPVADDPEALEVPPDHVRPADDAASGLIAEVNETTPHGLMCMSTRGRGDVGQLLFGSVAGQVLRELHAPLLTVGPGVEVDPVAPWRRMLVCLDGSATSAAILPTVRTWALELGLAVDLLHIAYPLGDPRVGVITVPEETRTIGEDLLRTAREFEAAGIDVGWHIVEDTEVAAGIVRQSALRLSDLIGLATHGRTGLARLLAGSVAMEVVRRSHVPTLVLRPEHLR